MCNPQESEKQDVSGETIGVKECRELRETTNAFTAACFLTKSEYLQIMVIFGQVAERLEREGRVTKE